MIPTSMANRCFIIVWFMYIVFAVCIFVQVNLAVVYANFQSETTTSTEKRKHQQDLGTQQAFNWLQTDGRVPEQDFAKACEVLSATGAFRVDEDLMRCIFLSLDDTGDGALNAKEFVDVQRVLLTNIWVTQRYSAFYI